MDPSTPNVQNQPNQSPAGRAQPPVATVPTQPAPPSMPQTISLNREEAPVQTAISQESSQAVEVKIAPSVPEVAVEKSVEQVVEISPNIEKPELPKIVKDAGVTLSGPGVPIQENSFGVTKLPMTYQQAAIEVKKTKLNDSRHWFVAKLMYIWRKINPDIAKEGGPSLEVKGAK